MPEYLAPGVYVEEVSGGIKPIEGVSTSTAGFVGATERGPTDPRLVTSFAQFQRIYGGFLGQDANGTQISYLPHSIKGFFDNGGRRAFIVRVVNSADASRASAEVGDFELEAVGPGEWGNNLRAWVDDSGTPKAGETSTRRFKLTIAFFSQGVPTNLTERTKVLEKADYIEQFDDLDVKPNSTKYVLSVLRTGSNLVSGTSSVPEPERPGNTGEIEGIQFNDGTAQNAVDRTTLLGEAGGGVDADGNERLATGLEALKGIDEVAILCIPDQGRVVDVHGDMVNQCENLKDRFAILQGENTWRKTSEFVNALGFGTSYAAVYHPWVRVFDPLSNDTILVPPSGHVAGVFARTDIERGVHKAPANEAVRGLYLRDVGTEKALSTIVSKGEHDLFNPSQINIVRDFRSDGRGIRVYGARTMSDDPEWRYVNVRRLFLFIEESIDEGTQWVVFEPNHDPTWAKVRRNISAFLISVWRSGALMGRTAEEAFFVKCDRTTMTQDDIDNGRLICVIGVAPVKPAEFVIFRISQKTAEAGA
jgi:hypothetical protein